MVGLALDTRIRAKLDDSTDIFKIAIKQYFISSGFPYFCPHSSAGIVIIRWRMNKPLHLQVLSFYGEEKWVNLLRRINTFGSSTYGAFLFNLKTSLSEKLLVG